MQLQSSTVRSKRKGYAGAGVSTAGTRSPTPKSENRKGNERRFFFYAGQLIMDHKGGHEKRAGFLSLSYRLPGVCYSGAGISMADTKSGGEGKSCHSWKGCLPPFRPTPAA
jgi:hypothetical protein